MQSGHIVTEHSSHMSEHSSHTTQPQSLQSRHASVSTSPQHTHGSVSLSELASGGYIVHSGLLLHRIAFRLKCGFGGIHSVQYL